MRRTSITSRLGWSAIPMSIFDGHAGRYGVFYPMQSFSKQRQVDFTDVSIFVIIRAISDKADNSGSMDYPTFEKAAAAHCAAIVEYMLKNL